MVTKVCLHVKLVATRRICGSLNMASWGRVMHESCFGAFPLHGTAQYGSLLGGFPLSTVPGTWYFFSTTSAEVPSYPYRYKNVMCNLYWSLIGRRKSSLLRHWTCNTRPNIDLLDLNQHSQWRIGCTFLYQPKNVCFVVCWGSTNVQSGSSESWMKKPYVGYILVYTCIFLEYVFC